MEIDEDWQTRRKYMQMQEEDRDSDIDEGLIKKITKLKQGVSSKEKLVAS